MEDDDLTFEVLEPSRERFGGVSSDALAVGRPRRPLLARPWLAIGFALVVLLALGLVGRFTSGPAAAERVTNPVPATASNLREAGFTGAIGGSLTGDPALVAALRTRVVALAPTHDAAVAGVRDVLILWVGDLNGRRYAVTTFREAAYGWSTAVLVGAAGAPASRMDAVGWVDGTSDDSLPAQSGATFLPGVVFVVAPATHGVEIATDYQPEGRRNTSWRPLHKQGGMVWVGLLDPAEQHLADYRTEKPEPFPDPAPVVVGRDAIIGTE